MKILILDDIKHRHEVFAKKYQGHEIVHVYKYSDFCAQLESNQFDLIHLDHDLGDFVADADTYVDGWGSTREFNGSHASMRVCELEDDKLPEKVIVHSINSVGAKNMLSNCQRRGIPVVWEPFSDPN